MKPIDQLTALRNHHRRETLSLFFGVVLPLGLMLVALILLLVKYP